MIDGVMPNRPNKTKKIKRVIFQISDQGNSDTNIMTLLEQVN